MEQTAWDIGTAAISPREIKSDVTQDKAVLVEVRLSLPFFTLPDDKPTARRLNAFYDFLARTLLRYAKNTLRRDASARLRDCLQNDRPFQPASLITSFFVTGDRKNVLSIVVDRTETDGSVSLTMRTADNWHMPGGTPILRLLSRGAQKQVLRACEENALLRQRAGSQLYFEGLSKNLRRYFQADQCYLTPDSLAVFYQASTISPLTEGLPEFTLERG